MRKRKSSNVAVNVLCYCIVCLIASCSAQKKNFSPQKKISPAQLYEDYTILNKALHQNHPGLYWYTTKDSLDHYFSSLEQAIKDSLNEQQFKNKVAYVLSKIHCGHTTVRSSENYVHYFTKHNTPQFPLQLKLWGDSAVVVQNYIAKDTILTRGTSIKSINNRSIGLIRDSIFQLIGTDGYADIFKYQSTSLSFASMYKNAFGLDSVYSITYADSMGNEKVHQIKNYYPPQDNKKVKSPTDTITRRERSEFALNRLRTIWFDSATNTAIMPVNTFSEGKLARFFRKSFKRIQQQNTKNLIIDLRINTGGDVLVCTRLLQYLVDSSFRLADTVVANSRTFASIQHTKPWFIYWLSMLISGRRDADNKIHFRYFERHQYHPNKKYHFDGQIYLLTGGLTFSGATLVAGILKGQQNVTIVGEETGGGYYGNNAIFLPTLTLPNTGIRITLPLYRVVWNKNRTKNGRGVFPDVEVRPNAVQLKNGIDAKLEKAFYLIKNNLPKNKTTSETAAQPK